MLEGCTIKLSSILFILCQYNESLKFADLECTDSQQPRPEIVVSLQPECTNSLQPDSMDHLEPKCGPCFQLEYTYNPQSVSTVCTELKLTDSQQSMSQHKNGEETEQFQCPCGDCELLTYLDKGCPKTNSESCSYPYLPVNTLSEVDREDLIQKLSHDTSQIIKCFANLLSTTSESLKKRQIPITRLVKMSLDYGAYESATNEVPLLKEDELKLEQATSIDGAFIILRKHMSFFNHGILQHIIEHLGDENDQSKFSDFYDRFVLYCKRKVFEAPPAIFCPSGSEKSGRKQFIVLASRYLIKTLADVNSARSKIATILGLAVSTLRLERIDIGSVILIFSIPGMLSNVFPLKPANHAELKACGFTLIAPDTPTSQGASAQSQDLVSVSGMFSIFHKLIYYCIIIGCCPSRPEVGV